MTSLIRLGIFSIKFLQNSLGISWIQTNLISSIDARIFRGEGFLTNFVGKNSPKAFDRVKVGTIYQPFHEINLIGPEMSTTIIERL